MKRRSFLKSFLGLLALPFVPKVNAKPITKADEEYVAICETYPELLYRVGDVVKERVSGKEFVCCSIHVHKSGRCADVFWRNKKLSNH